MSNEVQRPNYWKSLNELAQNEAYEKFVHREFPENASELKDGVSRRSFLKVMGASIALAGFASCRRPVQKILPYSRQPEHVIPGKPLYYASAMPFQDTLTGLVVENHEGRPTKVEGNEMQEASGGATVTYNQASVLGMYDPDRSRYIRRDGERSSYEEFRSFCGEHFSDTSRNIVFLSEANSSPTYRRIRETAMNRFPNARWITFEPFGEDNRLEGTRLAFGRKLRTVNHFDNASVIVALDDDFLSPAGHKNSLQNVRRFAEGRRVTSTQDEMSRLYSVESTFTLTGANADNRLRLKSSDIPHFTLALAAKLAETYNELSDFAGQSNRFSDHEWITVLAEELSGSGGQSVVTVGDEHDPEVHAVVAAINAALGNAGTTVTWHEIPHADENNSREALAALAEELPSGEIDTLVMTGTNPVFTAPADLNFGEALGNVNHLIHLSDYYDETSRHAEWHVNRAHFLEAWGDGYSFEGQRSVVQPQIEPLHGGISEIVFLNTVATAESTSGYDLVRETWQGYYGSGFEAQWEQVLHDGVASAGHFSAVEVSAGGGLASAVQTLAGGEDRSDEMELVIRPDSTLYDGRYANNGWLMELPDPMTKITWDNVALMSTATAERLGVEGGGLGKSETSVVSITLNGTTVEIPAWIQPGHADDSITVTVGYGRSGIGRVADETGTDTYPLRTTSSMLYATGISVERTGEEYEIACTQDHHSMEGRSLLRSATMEQYRETPDFSSYDKAYGAELPGRAYAEEQEEREDDDPLSIFDSMVKGDYPDHEPQWGMGIDLNSCIGCGTCTIACQAENNIPVIGKREVSRGREMHWIRVDRYFEGDADNPRALHQPVPCMQCELAPCEQVCPVAATTHSEDGINQMTYNRCIGTRYCENNCPYKVRRFNFFNYSQEFLTDGDDPEIIQMAMNPEVTIRFRGVMEKCNYCTQRINRAKINRDIETNGETMKPADGTVQTACQQACPTNAIHFGDLSDADSNIVRIKGNDRNYLLLEELNTRPRTSYLAELRNPNLKLA